MPAENPRPKFKAGQLVHITYSDRLARVKEIFEHNFREGWVYTIPLDGEDWYYPEAALRELR